ncbi:MAG TPA: DUF3047 domain-containing protein [Methylomirabilota bacterium]|jgi:hypothetical protein|nr:DUF3047 domain-containing protein [Methylomirabilota bacterium]
MIAVLAGLALAAGAEVVVVEDWTQPLLGARGIPTGWRPYETIGGRPAYDFTVVESDGRRALLLKSHDDHSTIARELHVDLRATPILEWSWKAVQLPAGGDIRRKETSDLTAHIYVIWPRFPAMVRSRLIGYVWDAAAPVQTVEKSRKTGSVHFFVLRSGPGELGRWLTERRNVLEDYRRVFGEDPEDPRALALSIDTNDTHSEAEALIGRIAFLSAGAPR